MRAQKGNKPREGLAIYLRNVTSNWGWPVAALGWGIPGVLPIKLFGVAAVGVVMFFWIGSYAGAWGLTANPEFNSATYVFAVLICSVVITIIVALLSGFAAMNQKKSGAQDLGFEGLVLFLALAVFVLMPPVIWIPLALLVIGILMFATRTARVVGKFALQIGITAAVLWTISVAGANISAAQALGSGYGSPLSPAGGNPTEVAATVRSRYESVTETVRADISTQMEILAPIGTATSAARKTEIFKINNPQLFQTPDPTETPQPGSPDP